MSDAHSHGTSHGQPGGHAPGDDGINLGKIVVIGLGSLALFAVGILWSYQLMVGRQGEIHAQGLARRPTEIGKPEIGIVDQVPFSIDHRLEVWKAANGKRLSSYGWIDRAKGIAHMPIEQAMDQVIAAPPDIPGEGVPPVARPLPPSGVSTPSGSKTGGAP
jgi:hypothetical protein